MIMRGGSSKGAYFVAADLPSIDAERDLLLQQIMGTPDDRQIDGIGGAHPLTSKVAIVSASTRPDIDVEYLFLQVGVGEPTVTDRQNCGNLLAGVAPFAIERGLVKVEPTADSCSVTILMRNTDSIATATISVHQGAPTYSGDTSISGVPGSAAAVRLGFQDVAGSSCGALLPTGNEVDEVEGVRCTLIDNGMPVAVMRADELGVDGTESPASLEANQDLRARLEAIRLAAGQLMNLGDVSDTTVPKLTMVAAPQSSAANLNTRTFIPHRCHDAIGVLGAVSVATAAQMTGSPAHELMVQSATASTDSVVLEHPTGTFEAVITDDHAGIIRTARKLMDGIVFPRSY